MSDLVSSDNEDVLIGRRVQSPFTLSYGDQVKLCLRRGFWRLKADPSLTLTQLFGNFIMNLIISSVFFNLRTSFDLLAAQAHPAEPITGSFFQRGSLLFFAILINAFGAALEVRRDSRIHARGADPNPDPDAVCATPHCRKAHSICLVSGTEWIIRTILTASYHSSAEAFASMITDLPYKILSSIINNLTLYFMTNLRREPGQYQIGSSTQAAC